MEKYAIEYVAGCVLRKFNFENCDSHINEDGENLTSSNSFIDIVDRGGLVKPTEHITNFFILLENIFNNTDFYSLDILKTLLDNSNHVPELTSNQKLMYFRTRIYSRTKYLNTKIRESKPNTQYNKLSNESKKIKHFKTYTLSLLFPLIIPNKHELYVYFQKQNG